MASNTQEMGKVHRARLWFGWFVFCLFFFLKKILFNFIFFLLASIAYLNHSIANESEKIIKFYVKFGSSKDTLFLGALVHSPLAQAAADSDYDMTNFSAYQVFHFFCLIVLSTHIFLFYFACRCYTQSDV